MDVVIKRNKRKGYKPMYEAIKKIAEYCNSAWKGNFSPTELKEYTEEYVYSIKMSNRDHIDEVILSLLCGLAEDSMNGNEEAEQYYEAIMDYIMAA